LRSAEAASRLERFGRNELTENVKPKWKIFVEQFTGPMPCMIWMAAGVELIIHDWPNFWILMVLQSVNGLLGYHESTKAGDAVAALKVSSRMGRRPQASVERLRPAWQWIHCTLRMRCDTCGWWDNGTARRIGS
jgi:H+-transporting ATPase